MNIKPNELLRQARLSQLSPSGSGRVMSRQDLAEAVNAFIFARFNRSSYVDAPYIGKLERGLIQWPRAHLRAGLRAALGVDKDSDLGFFNMYGAERPAKSVEQQTKSGFEVTTGDTLNGVQKGRDVWAGEESSTRISRENIDDAHIKLCAELRDRRNAAGLTQADFAKRVGYSRSTVANVEASGQKARRHFWENADRVVGARGALLAEFEQVRQLSAAYHLQSINERRQLSNKESVSAGPAGGADGDTQFLPASLNGGFVLSVTATDAGGLRVVIETGCSPYPGVGAGTAGDGARVYSFVQAQRARAAHPG